MEWKRYIQHQKPMAHLLTACTLPLVAGIANFGWRVLFVTLATLLACWGAEYAFTRKAGKPATMACLVTGMLLSLILPPNLPIWIAMVGGAFAIVFGKMAFGGFGKNIFNPAMVGRCFLYICFPVAVVTTWYAPTPWYGVEGASRAAGFTRWTVETKCLPYESQPDTIDALTSATPLRALKGMNKRLAAGEGVEAIRPGFDSIPLDRLLIGNQNGCVGETSAIAILLALAYLLFRKTVQPSLVIAPLLGLILTASLYSMVGWCSLPLGKSLLVNILSGGTLFAITFMTTEPVSAPRNERAKWLYGMLIGFFAVTIRSFSIWPAGLMFSILLGNMFGPLIEIGCEALEKKKGGAHA